MLVYLKKEITLVLLLLSFKKLTVCQTCIEWVSNCSRGQFLGDVTARKILMSLAKRSCLEYMIVLHKSFMNLLKIRHPKTDPCETPENTPKATRNSVSANMRLSFD
jgi:hypothetical protein